MVVTVSDMNNGAMHFRLLDINLKAIQIWLTESLVVTKE
jgi:hypothetical protein